MRQVRIKRLPQAGLTLVELVIALALGQLIVLAISTAVAANYFLYTAATDVLTVHETGRHALDIIGHSIRHAGYAKGKQPSVDQPFSSERQAVVFGLDARTLPATSQSLDGARLHTYHHQFSDVLAVRSGSDIPNCAGLRAPAQRKSDDIYPSWSIYYVANDASGTPNLYCKFNSGGQGRPFSAQSIAQGIEAFRVQYQLDSGDRFLNATAIAALDGSRHNQQHPAGAWSKVTAVNIALLVRGSVKSALHRSPGKFQLFDGDVTMGLDDLDPNSRGLAHAIFRTTIALRNPQHDGADTTSSRQRIGCDLDVAHGGVDDWN